MEGYLDVAEVARRLDIKPTTVHRYRATGIMPDADEYVGQSPLWREETINAWLASRPGHGWRKGQTAKD